MPLDHGRYEIRRRLPTGPATNELEIVGPLAAKAVKRGVDANFDTLRDILERGGL